MTVWIVVIKNLKHKQSELLYLNDIRNIVRISTLKGKGRCEAFYGKEKNYVALCW